MLKKLRELSNLKRITGGAAFILAGIAVIGAFALPAPPSKPASTHSTTLNVQQSGQVKGDATVAPHLPVLTMKTVTENEPIPYTSSNQPDANLPVGQSQVITKGVDGVETFTYSVSYSDGIETNKVLLSKVVTTPVVNEVVAVGTEAPSPTIQCQPAETQTSPAPLSVTITGVTAVNKADGFVYVHTQPCADLTITITYTCTGDNATSLSLYQPVKADPYGDYVWPWVPDTKCHTGLALVTANWDGKSASTHKRFLIQPK